MNVLEHMMKLYEESLEELMDSQKYTKCYEKVTNAEDKSMYRTLAKQELEHEAMIVKAGDRLFSGIDASDSLHTVWHHLKKHLHEWRSSLEMRLADK